MRTPTRSLLSTCSVLTAAILVAGCGSRPTDNQNTGTEASGATAGSGNFSVCMVLDTGGVDDRSFNQSAWGGLSEAAKENADIAASYVPSADDTSYRPNLEAAVQKKCQSIIGVGGLMADDLTAVAQANPDSDFAEIDAPSKADNVYGIQFNTAEASFLAGYLAAEMTQTGVVGTWGGLNIPPVAQYMDGFWEGVQYHNSEKGTSVKVLGWDQNNPGSGTFANSFSDQAAGRQITETLVSQGADIIMPVAGGAGLGAGAAAQAADGKLKLIWVDTDGCESAEQFCSYFLTAVTKNITDAVTQYVDQSAGGTKPSGSYVGTLANNGVGLASFHDFDSKVPAELKTELETVKQGIIDGQIKLTSPNAIASN